MFRRLRDKKFLIRISKNAISCQVPPYGDQRPFLEILILLYNVNFSIINPFSSSRMDIRVATIYYFHRMARKLISFPTFAILLIAFASLLAHANPMPFFPIEASKDAALSDYVVKVCGIVLVLCVVE
ncbi:hypothetical protein EV424DRAFT_334961 [Suillus variegatus]|nr:hypothetical protein EV424DRAFT_334961 [Suillus variegatus]